MSEFVVKLSPKLKRTLQESPGIEAEVRKFIQLKAFEEELRGSVELQKFVFEALRSKSRLSGKNASELGEKVNRGLLQELREEELL